MATGIESSSITSEWLKQHAQLYSEATFHPFIQSIKNGSIDFNCFKRWLSQDYIFVREFVRFLASVLLKTPKNSTADIDIILGGLAALEQEISWFKKEASNWEVDLINCNPQKSNQDYCRFLESLMQPDVEYAVIIVAFWTIEVVYCDSFATCLESDAKTSPLLLEACQRWGNQGFKQYCMSLQKIADKALNSAPQDVQHKAEETFTHVLRNEIEFWNMSYGYDMK
ncbi:bifunctional TENA2 protein isoform X1 [Cryptomeria japonica]|uniref:bifunctional TENA2 protein isoform X1 n=1 Tax=Cryptomeria japonica TaxID=3369 RepID=UPI0027D9D0D6|nr:bifunctional TENA2 protein isoform X1 [Cryptomeria japonica]